MRDPERAKLLLRFFRTGPGDYGEGDRFLGLRVPQMRAVASQFASMPLEGLEKMLASKWHEARMLALVIMTKQYERGDDAARDAIFRLYLANTHRINNWDLVDVSAPKIVGAHVAGRGGALLTRLAKSKSLWERRIAILAGARAGETFRIAKLLLHDAHDLIHKAVGWMLREAGKRDRAALESFLDEHAATMPRTMLRYAIEKFSPEERRRYLLARADRIVDFRGVVLSSRRTAR